MPYVALARRSVLLAVLALSSIAWAEQERAPHPEPRVIVSVHSVHGPHSKPALERAARLAWGKIVRCYKNNDERVTGSVNVTVDVSRHGKVIGVRRMSSTFRSKSLSRCLAGTMKGLAMPTAARGSSAKVEIRVAPGDP